MFKPVLWVIVSAFCIHSVFVSMPLPLPPAWFPSSIPRTSDAFLLLSRRTTEPKQCCHTLWALPFSLHCEAAGANLKSAAGRAPLQGHWFQQDFRSNGCLVSPGHVNTLILTSLRKATLWITGDECWGPFLLIASLGSWGEDCILAAWSDLQHHALLQMPTCHLDTECHTAPSGHPIRSVSSWLWLMPTLDPPPKVLWQLGTGFTWT